MIQCCKNNEQIDKVKVELKLCGCAALLFSRLETNKPKPDDDEKAIPKKTNSFQRNNEKPNGWNGESESFIYLQ